MKIDTLRYESKELISTVRWYVQTIYAEVVSPETKKSLASDYTIDIYYTVTNRKEHTKSTLKRIEINYNPLPTEVWEKGIEAYFDIKFPAKEYPNIKDDLGNIVTKIINKINKFLDQKNIS